MKINFPKTALYVGISTALLGGSALASAHDWSGAYIGGTLGQNSLTGQANAYYGDFSATDSDVGYGLTIGYNKQNGAAVYGVEADANFGNMNEGKDGYDASTYYEQAQWNMYSTIRGRAGLAVDNALLYVTAGLAIVNTNYKYCDEGKSLCHTDSSDAFSRGDEYGTAFGGGMEVALDNNLSVKGEIMNVQLDTQSVHRDCCHYPGGDSVNFKSSLTTVRVGANWKF